MSDSIRSRRAGVKNFCILTSETVDKLSRKIYDAFAMEVKEMAERTAGAAPSRGRPQPLVSEPSVTRTSSLRSAGFKDSVYDRAAAVARLVARAQLARNPHHMPQPYALVRVERLISGANAHPSASEINAVLTAAGYYPIYATVDVLLALLPDVLEDMKRRDSELVDGLLADLGMAVRL